MERTGVQVPDYQGPWVIRQAGWVVGGGTLVALILLVISVRYPTLFASGLSHRLGPKERADVLASGRDVGLKLAAAVGALTAGILGWGRLELAKDERDVARITLVAQQFTLDAQRLTGDAERFARAVDQIGSDKGDVVLGGLYALEALADSAEDYQSQITEVLSAFIREHVCTRAPPSPSPLEEATRPLTVTEQAALTILGRHQSWRRQRIDLTEANLSEVNLTHAYLAGATLTSTYLISADLTGANLNAANLSGTDLSDANLSGTDLTNADLFGANFCEANLIHADLSGADLRRADLRRADLRYAKLIRVGLIGADLTGANLTDADLTTAILADDGITSGLGTVALVAADLTGADLTRANFTGAVLGTVTLVAANLSETNFARTSLKSANLTGARWMTGRSPIWPSGFTPRTQSHGEFQTIPFDP